MMEVGFYIDRQICKPICAFDLNEFNRSASESNQFEMNTIIKFKCHSDFRFKKCTFYFEDVNYPSTSLFYPSENNENWNVWCIYSWSSNLIHVVVDPTIPRGILSIQFSSQTEYSPGVIHSLKKDDTDCNRATTKNDDGEMWTIRYVGSSGEEVVFEYHHHMMHCCFFYEC